MQSNQDGPTLTLSDIMHTPSPSPGPQPPTQVQTDQSPVDSQVVPQQSSFQSFYVHSNPSAPLADPSDSETISSAELHSIRSRLSELSLTHVDSSQNGEQSNREKEIITLVCYFYILCLVLFLTNTLLGIAPHLLHTSIS